MRFAAWCPTALTVVLASGTALAQQPAPAASQSAPATSGTSRDPEALINEGLDLRTARRDEEALARFQAAYEITPTPRAMAQIALAEQALGRWVDAERHMRAALATPSDPWIQRNHTQLNRALTTIQTHLGSLEVRANVPGAELWIGQQRVATLPTSEPVRVPVGSTRIQVRAPEHATVERVVTIDQGGLARESVELQRGDPGTPAGGGGQASVGAGATGGIAPGAAGSERPSPRARGQIVFALGAGTSFFVPSIGLGVRFPVVDRVELQARADLTFMLQPFGPIIGIAPLFGVEGTVRVRPLSPTSIWYLGAGVAMKLGVLIPVAYDTMANPTAPPPSFFYVLGGVIETGFFLGATERWDLSFRFIGGVGFNGVISLGYSL